MKPTFVEKGPLFVAGVEREYDPRNESTAVFHDLWENEFWPRYGEIAALCEDKGFYGVWSGEVGGKVAYYLAGAAVADRDAVPPGLTVRSIPAARYAVFECTVATIGQTYGAIFGERPSRSVPKLDESRPHFEYYPPGTTSADSTVFIYVPLVKGDGS